MAKVPPTYNNSNEHVNPNRDQDLHEFSSGAVRSPDGDDMRLDLLCPTALMRVARVYKEGADKYDKGGMPNWTKGIPIRNVLGHALHHLLKYLAHDRSEDHLAKACWGLFAIMHYQNNCAHDKTVVEHLYVDAEYQDFRQHQPVQFPPGMNKMVEPH